MNKIVNKFLLAGDKLHELHLRQPGFTYSSCGSFIINCEMIRKLKQTCNLQHIYQNELHQACFTHDTDSKDFAKITISDKIFKDRADEIAINSKHDGYQRGLASMVCNFFNKEATLGATRKAGASVNEELAQEFHKPVIKNERNLCQI